MQSLGGEDPLEEEMATHSDILAWKIPWTEKPHGLQPLGSQESDMTEQLSTHTYSNSKKKKLTWEKSVKIIFCYSKRMLDSNRKESVLTLHARPVFLATFIIIRHYGRSQRILPLYLSACCA